MLVDYKHESRYVSSSLFGFRLEWLSDVAKFSIDDLGNHEKEREWVSWSMEGGDTCDDVSVESDYNASI